MEKLTGALQENLLTLLCFSDTAAQLIRSSVTPELFSSVVYRNVVQQVHAYIDQFHEPPKQHLPDLLEDELSTGADVELYHEVVQQVNELSKHINETYVMSQLSSFVRLQQLKLGVIRAGEYLQSDEPERAEVELEAALKTRLALFSPGVTLSEGFSKSLTHARVDYILTGIPELDRSQLGPARGELHLFLGPAKRGKSWWLVHLAKKSMMQRLRTLAITLEISDLLWTQRLVQSLFAVSRRQAKIDITRLVKDDLGRFVGLKKDTMDKILTLDDPRDVRKVKQRIARTLSKDNVIIKGFPTGQLDMNGLRAYLDSLERLQRFTPDVILLDYPALMKMSGDTSRLRNDIGENFKNLRGLAVERNLAMCVVGQANRAGAEAKMVKDTNASEDFSQIFTADTVLTYSQTMAERNINLARLYVSNTRVGDDDRFVILMSQAYKTGQFCLDSAMMRDTYFSHVENLAANNKADSEGTA